MGDGTTNGYVDLFPANDATNSVGFTTTARSTKLRLQLPSSDPIAGQTLACGAPSSNVSVCGWVTPSSGSSSSTVSATMTIDLPAGGAGSNIVTGPWDLGGNGGGGNLFYRGLDFSSSGAPGFKASFRLPANFDKTKTVSVLVTGGNVNGVGGTVLLKVQIACYGAAQALYSDPTYGTAASVTITQTADSKTTEGTAASLPLAAACDSNKMARVLVSRDNTVSGNMTDVYSVLDVALTYGAK